jgi:hypothetical protein
VIAEPPVVAAEDASAPYVHNCIKIKRRATCTPKEALDPDGRPWRLLSTWRLAASVRMARPWVAGGRLAGAEAELGTLLGWNDNQPDPETNIRYSPLEGGVGHFVFQVRGTWADWVAMHTDQSQTFAWRGTFDADSEGAIVAFAMTGTGSLSRTFVYDDCVGGGKCKTTSHPLLRCNVKYDAELSNDCDG